MSARASRSCVVLLVLVASACGGGPSTTAPSSSSTTSTQTPTPTPAPTQRAFSVCVEWADANWTLTFAGKTFSGGGLTGSILTGEQCFNLSAAANTIQTISGTFAQLNQPGAFGAFGVTLPAGGPATSLVLLSGPPCSFVNSGVYVSWTQPFGCQPSFPTSPAGFQIQFKLA